jgi:hypothetical protein
LQGARSSRGARADAGRAIALARSMHHARSMDFIALAIAFGFFAASWGFIALCERLR